METWILHFDSYYLLWSPPPDKLDKYVRGQARFECIQSKKYGRISAEKEKINYLEKYFSCEFFYGLLYKMERKFIN